ncbi:MAG TPA: hypothetical protein VGN26_03900 [Armatimonadota bacterium]
MANELLGAERWLYAKLTADTTLQGLIGSRIYSDVAPNGSSYPLIILSNNSEQDVVGAAGDRLLARPLYLVNLVTNTGSVAVYEQLINRIDEVLTLTVPEVVTLGSKTYTILSCVRERTVRYAQVEDKTDLRYIGGLYRLDIAPA